MTQTPETVRVTRLPNGLTVVSETMPRVETVSVGAYVNVGTRNEEAAENGVSHFLEHMAFKGTARRDAAAIAREIENVGGHLNAYTAREQTAYYAKVLKEDTGLAVDIIGDILTHSVFAPEEVERERGVILQEIGQANDTPDDIIFDHFQTAAFPDQPMGRPVLGTEDTVKAMTRDGLAGYMRRHYGPQRMVIAGAGALEHEQLLDLVQQHFADLPVADALTEEPARYTGGEFREERDLDQIHIVLGFPSVAHREPDYYPTQLLSVLLGGGMSSRLFQEIRENRGLCYTIFAQAGAYEDTGMTTIYAGTSAEDILELAGLTATEIARSADDMTEAEVARAKAQMKAGMLMGLESPSQRAERLARMLAIWGRVPGIDEAIEKIDGVSVADVRAFGARMAGGTGLALTVYGPEGAAPTLDSLRERLAA